MSPPFSAIFPGGNPLRFLEYFIKVTVVFDAAVSGDGFDLKIGETEHLFGFGDPQGSQVVSHGDAKAFFKFT